MPKDEAMRIAGIAGIANHNWHPGVDVLYHIDNRFVLGFKFDEDERLIRKVIYEPAVDEPAGPSWLQQFFWKQGLPLGRLYLSWPA